MLHRPPLCSLWMLVTTCLACSPGVPSRGAPSDSAASSGPSGAGGGSSGAAGGASPGTGGGWPALGGSAPGPTATASSAAASTSGSAKAASSSSATGVGGAVSTGSSSSAGGAAGCGIGHVVLGEVRTRGGGGASDEFVALFNATPSPVTLDATWQLSVRSTTDASYRAHWTGSGQTIPAFGHFLIAGTAYAQMPVPDDRLTSGIPDAASVCLIHGGASVDALCFGYDPQTMASYDASFTCAGTVASNLPHNNTSSAASDVDASLARLPGGAAGNCVDTGDNAADFVTERPATPESTASGPTP